MTNDNDVGIIFSFYRCCSDNLWIEVGRIGTQRWLIILFSFSKNLKFHIYNPNDFFEAIDEVKNESIGSAICGIQITSFVKKNCWVMAGLSVYPTRNHISPVVYFDQCLGASHPKGWLKYAFLLFSLAKS